LQVPQEPADGARRVAREALSRDTHDEFDLEFCNDPFAVPGVPDKMYLRHFRSDPASRSTKRLVIYYSPFVLLREGYGARGMH